MAGEVGLERGWRGKRSGFEGEEEVVGGGGRRGWEFSY